MHRERDATDDAPKILAAGIVAHADIGASSSPDRARFQLGTGQFDSL